MIEFNIFQKITVSKINRKIEYKKLRAYKEGIYNPNDLRNSATNKYLFEIPQKNQIELNEKGETTYTIIKTTVVTIRRKSSI